MTLKERLARVKFVSVKADVSGLTTSELAALRCCVSAAKTMTEVYVEQAAHGNLALRDRLSCATDPDAHDRRQFFTVQGTGWDQFDDAPFMPGLGEKPKFGSFYPSGFTKQEFEGWLAAHPEDREAFESWYTVIHRTDGGGLRAVPYSEQYQVHLAMAARDLRWASRLLSPGPLATFLAARADAFESNQYFHSDLAWVDTDGNPFEVTIGPYEVYFDRLLGLKAAYEAHISLPDQDATAALAKFSPAVPEFDGILSQEFSFKPKGAAIPLQVMSDVVRGGEAAFGYMSVAYNLPNDRNVHELKGSKKVFSRTMMQAKFDGQGRPVAECVLDPSLLSHATFQNRFLFVLAHELAHGLGPALIERDGKKVRFETLLGDQHTAIEEAKADVLGARLLGYFHSRGTIDDDTLAGALVTQVAGCFAAWLTLGMQEAHARGDLVQYNWLRHHGAVRFDGVVHVDVDRTLAALSDLSTEFIRLQVAGDYDKAKAFVEHWAVVPDHVPGVLARLSHVPRSIFPIFNTDF